MSSTIIDEQKKARQLAVWRFSIAVDSFLFCFAAAYKLLRILNCLRTKQLAFLTPLATHPSR